MKKESEKKATNSIQRANKRTKGKLTTQPARVLSKMSMSMVVEVNLFTWREEKALPEGEQSLCVGRLTRGKRVYGKCVC